MELYHTLSIRASVQEIEAKTLLYTIPPGRLLKIEEIETLRNPLNEQELLKACKLVGLG